MVPGDMMFSASVSGLLMSGIAAILLIRPFMRARNSGLVPAGAKNPKVDVILAMG
ncbi:hypothetical protein D9M69_621650 [compost metagenome]